MNSNVVPSRVQMDNTLLQQLMTEVKETIASGMEVESAKAASFKAIDFWNIRRNGRFVNSGSGRKKNASLSITHVSF